MARTSSVAAHLETAVEFMARVMQENYATGQASERSQGAALQALKLYANEARVTLVEASGTVVSLAGERVL